VKTKSVEEIPKGRPRQRYRFTKVEKLFKPMNKIWRIITTDKKTIGTGEA